MTYEWIERRIAEMAHKGVTKAGFARALGIDPARVSEMLRGDRRLHADEVLPAARYLQIDSGAFLQHLYGDDARLENIKVYNVPVVGTIEAGPFKPVESQEVDYPTRPIPDDLRQQWGNRGLFILTVRGDSMNRQIGDGAEILCLPFEHWPWDVEDGTILVIRRERDGLFETTLKAVKFRADGGVSLCPQSTADHETVELPPPSEWGHDLEVTIHAVPIWVSGPPSPAKA